MGKQFICSLSKDKRQNSSCTLIGYIIHLQCTFFPFILLISSRKRNIYFFGKHLSWKIKQKLEILDLESMCIATRVKSVYSSLPKHQTYKQDCKFNLKINRNSVEQVEQYLSNRYRLCGGAAAVAAALAPFGGPPPERQLYS